MTRSFGGIALSAACVVLALGTSFGCSARQAEPTATSPAVQVEQLQVGNATCLGMKLLTADGRPFAFLIRADRGIVASPHTDIASLAKAGFPAATAKNWTTNGLRGELSEKVLAVNAPAAARGVKAGMTVEEALKLMSDRRP